MSWNILITAPYFLPVVERFRPLFAEHRCQLRLAQVQERLEEAALLPLMAEVDGVICGDDRFTARVIAAAPRLRVIAKWGTGIDSIDQAACQARGIAVRNTPNAFSEAVGDTVLGYMLAFARNLVAMDRGMKQGEWRKLPGRTLAECTLGVIGVGNTGRAVLRRGQALGMTLLGTDIRPVEPVAGLTLASREELLQRADFVCIQCDLNPTSFHLMNDAAFALMRPDAVLINAARGPVVEEAALVRALQAGRIAGAALDVFEREPLPPESPLRAMDNVLLAPHNANSSPRAWERIHHNTVKNLLDVLTGAAAP